MLMKRYSIFSMNAILPRNCGKVWIPFLINVIICHNLHHRLPFFDSLIPTLIIYYLKTTFFTVQNLYIQLQKQEKVLLNNLIRNVTKIQNAERNITENNERKIMLYTEKVENDWKQVNRVKMFVVLMLLLAAYLSNLSLFFI